MSTVFQRIMTSSKRTQVDAIAEKYAKKQWPWVRTDSARVQKAKALFQSAIEEAIATLK